MLFCGTLGYSESCGGKLGDDADALPESEETGSRWSLDLISMLGGESPQKRPRGRGRRTLPLQRSSHRGSTLSRADSISIATDGRDSLNRASYDVADLAYLTRRKVRAVGAAPEHLVRYDSNGDGVVQFGELQSIAANALNMDLPPYEACAIYDALDNSFEYLRLTDLASFMGDEAGKPYARFESNRGDTVTCVGLSPGAKRAACGGMDRRVVVWDLAHFDLAPLFEREYAKPVAALALGRAGLAVGLFSPGDVMWYASLDEDTPTWTYPMLADVQGLALNETDGEIAVSAGNALTVFKAETGETLAKFKAFGAVTGVAMARVLMHRLILQGQGGNELLVRNEIRIDSIRSMRASRDDSRMGRRIHGFTPRRVALESPESKFFTAPQTFATGSYWQEPEAELVRTKAIVIDASTPLKKHDSQWSAPPGEPDLCEESTISGCTLRISRVDVTRFSEVMLQTLDSVWPNVILGALVIASVVVLAQQLAGTLPDGNAAAAHLNVWVVGIFCSECAIRITCHVQLHRSLKFFFREWNSVVDLVVSSLDLAVSIYLEVAGDVKNVRVYRLVRGARAIRLVRTCRLRKLVKEMLASEPNRRKYYRYDVETSTGHVLHAVDRADVSTFAEAAFSKLVEAAFSGETGSGARPVATPGKVEAIDFVADADDGVGDAATPHSGGGTRRSEIVRRAASEVARVFWNG